MHREQLFFSFKDILLLYFVNKSLKIDNWVEYLLVKISSIKLEAMGMNIEKALFKKK